MLRADQVCPAEIPPPKRRLTSVKPEYVRYRGKAERRIPPLVRELYGMRQAGPLPITPRAALVAADQKIGTSSVYKRGDVKRSKGEWDRVGYKSGGWFKTAKRRGWCQSRSIEAALSAARTIEEMAPHCRVSVVVSIGRKPGIVGSAPFETYWYRVATTETKVSHERPETPKAAPAPLRIAQGRTRMVKTFVDAPKRLRV